MQATANNFIVKRGLQQLLDLIDWVCEYDRDNKWIAERLGVSPSRVSQLRTALFHVAPSQYTIKAIERALERNLIHNNEQRTRLEKRVATIFKLSDYYAGPDQTYNRA